MGADTYELTVDDGKADVARVTADADVSVTPRGLAMAYLGDRTFRSLAQSRLAQAHGDAAVRADAMFSVSPAPQCLTLF